MDDIAYNNRGNLYAQAGEYELAINDYTHALKIIPDDAIVYQNRARCYDQICKYKMAIDDYTKAIDIEPVEELYNARGRIFQELGDYQNAQNDFKTAYELNPDSEATYKALHAIQRKLMYSKAQIDPFLKTRLKKPFSALITFKTENRAKTSDDLLGLGNALYQWGFTLKQPSELRYSYQNQNHIDLVLTFVDEEHARIWLDHPLVQKYYSEKFSQLLAPPKVIEYPDALIEMDQNANCVCPTYPFILLQADPFGEKSPLICGDCLNPIVLDHFEKTDGFSHWSHIHNHIYHMWLDSGLYEKWAETQIGDYHSELNTKAIQLIKDFYKDHQIRIYYRKWEDDYETENRCPECKKKGEPTQLRRPAYICNTCHLAFGELARNKKVSR